MNAHRDLAIAAMKLETQRTIGNKDFVVKAGLELPPVCIPGSLPATQRTAVDADELKLPLDVVMNWTIGDYEGTNDWSDYYDAASPWYNVFFGAYALRSYKLDGAAFGYDTTGKPDFLEFFEVPRIDYNNLLAGQFGATPDQMSFEVQETVVSAQRIKGWDSAHVRAIVPSGLHYAPQALMKPYSYIVYGIPGNHLLEDHKPFEKVEMRGQMYMRQVPESVIDREKVPQPITMAFGALCPATQGGSDLLDRIMAALSDTYLPLYPES